MAIQDQLTLASRVASHPHTQIGIATPWYGLPIPAIPIDPRFAQIARFLHRQHQRQIRFTGRVGPSSEFDRLLNEGQRLSGIRHYWTSSAFFVLKVTVFSPGTRLAAISQTSEPPELGTIAKKK